MVNIYKVYDFSISVEKNILIQFQVKIKKKKTVIIKLYYISFLK